MTFRNKNSRNCLFNIHYLKEEITRVVENSKLLGIHIVWWIIFLTPYYRTCSEKLQELLSWGNAIDKGKAFEAQKKCARYLCGI